MSRLTHLTMAGLALGLSFGVQAADSDFIPTAQLSYGGALKYIDATRTAAQEAGMNVCIAMVDPGGHLIALARMDGAFPGCVDAAIAKAKTAALFQRDSSVLGNAMRNGAPVNELPNVTPLGGGIALKHEEVLVGALGVSGDVEKTEQALAERVVRDLQL